MISVIFVLAMWGIIVCLAACILGRTIAILIRFIGWLLRSP